MKNQVKALKTLNKDQQAALSLLTKDTEYEEQISSITQEIGKWKQKYKVLEKYKREEEINFKSKFDSLMNAEENRFKMKMSVNQLKYTKEALPALQRVVSQPQIGKKGGAEQLIRSKDAIDKVYDSTMRRYDQKKRDIEKTELELLNEIEQLRGQIETVDHTNTETKEQLKEYTVMTRTMKMQQHRRNASQEDIELKEQQTSQAKMKNRYKTIDNNNSHNKINKSQSKSIIKPIENSQSQGDITFRDDKQVAQKPVQK